MSDVVVRRLHQTRSGIHVEAEALGSTGSSDSELDAILGGVAPHEARLLGSTPAGSVGAALPACPAA